MEQTSRFVNGVANIKLGKTILQVQRDGGDSYKLLVDAKDGSLQSIAKITLDSQDLLLAVGINGSRPLHGLGCTMRAEGYTARFSNKNE